MILASKGWLNHPLFRLLQWELNAVNHGISRLWDSSSGPLLRISPVGPSATMRPSSNTTVRGKVRPAPGSLDAWTGPWQCRSVTSLPCSGNASVMIHGQLFRHQYHIQKQDDNAPDCSGAIEHDHAIFHRVFQKPRCDDSRQKHKCWWRSLRPRQDHAWR
jgi:hypothetical protein